MNEKYSDIKMFAHCKNCNTGQLAVGQTQRGVVIWCEDCDMEVYFIDGIKMFDPGCECVECGDDYENKEDLK